MELQGISVVWLPVTDMQRAVTFYSDTLGMSVKSQEDEWAELKADGVTIGLNGRKEETPSGEGGAVLALSPAGGIDAAVEELKGKGVDFAGDISDHPWGRVASFHDPDGNSLQLFEAPQG
jgi:predicted enzyme related to lactoylglutathione lyase